MPVSPTVANDIATFLKKQGGVLALLILISYYLYERQETLEAKYEDCMFTGQEKMRQALDNNTRVLERIENRLIYQKPESKK